jgi:hypothetical protein
MLTLLDLAVGLTAALAIFLLLPIRDLLPLLVLGAGGSLVAAWLGGGPLAAAAGAVAAMVVYGLAVKHWSDGAVQDAAGHDGPRLSIFQIDAHDRRYRWGRRTILR